jgi:hypothetical protein
VKVARVAASEEEPLHNAPCILRACERRDKVRAEVVARVEERDQPLTRVDLWDGGARGACRFMRNGKNTERNAYTTNAQGGACHWSCWCV